MNADIRWIDNPEIFRVNQIAAHSDHDYFTNYEALNSNSHNLIQSLNGQWKFCFSRNAMSRPADFYKEDYDTSYFDKIMVPGHIELAGYDQIRYINTLYPWEGKTYRRGAYSIESAGDGTGMFSEAEYNPVGSYIKKFDLDKELCGKRVRLFFEGVEQAMYVWLNGEFIGYAEDSFTPSEFDLTPYINEETMPNLTKAMEECPELRAACTDRDGKIYSLPKKLPLRPTVCGNGLYINQDWLDNLGLEAPKTLDELTDVLLAFAKEDADGDGDPTNEIGLTNNAGTNLQADCQHILSVWGCMVSRNTNYMGLNNDGEAVFVPAQENYKEAVKWMHMLWENGVLDPEYFTQDTSSVTAKLQAEGGSKVGIISAWTADSEAGQNADQYSLMEAVEGYNDIHYVECATASLDITDRELVITTACEDPEALLKWADNFYDDLVSLQTFYGSLGVTVTANDDGTYSVHSTDDDTSLDTAAWSNALRDFGPKYMNPEFYDKVIIPDDVSDGIKLKEDEVNAKYVTTDKNTGMPALQYTEDELNRITAIGTDVYSYVESMYAHWVVDGGVEDEWDSYIDQLNAMGLEELVSLQQGAYAAYLESME